MRQPAHGVVLGIFCFKSAKIFHTLDEDKKTLLIDKKTNLCKDSEFSALEVPVFGGEQQALSTI